jgi:hypothetical protein
MDRELMLKLWDEQTKEGLWAAGWERALGGLSAQQAAWRPPPTGVSGERHSIWQNVHHVTFWLGVGLKRALRGEGPSKEEVLVRNFEAPAEVSDAAWHRAVDRLRQVRADVRAAIADASVNAERWPYMLAHDSYHLGQIMMLRGMQGMQPVE